MEDSALNTILSAMAQLDAGGTLPAGIKTLLVTLHFFFPNELLPALDLLDRRLLTRLLPDRPGDDGAGAEAQAHVPAAEVWYVQSAAAAASSTGAGVDSARNKQPSQTRYEVRLDSWNCTCAGFAFQAFQRISTSTSASSTRNPTTPTRPSSTTTMGMGVPVCKHILAATLAAAAPQLFADAVARREAAAEELAGRAVGWDDYG